MDKEVENEKGKLILVQGMKAREATCHALLVIDSLNIHAKIFILMNITPNLLMNHL